jgi:cell wall-associated NlpC family hydrolase
MKKFLYMFEMLIIASLLVVTVGCTTQPKQQGSVRDHAIRQKPTSYETAPDLRTPNPVQPGNRSSQWLAEQIIQTGERYMGTPYHLGAKSGQTDVFDCSSFVQYIYGLYGIDLPRTSRQQATVGITVPKSEIRKGDLLFFKRSDTGDNIGNVGIYAGNNQILHTWGPGGVRYDNIEKGWLKEGFVVAKRVLPEY